MSGSGSHCGPARCPGGNLQSHLCAHCSAHSCTICTAQPASERRSLGSAHDGDAECITHCPCLASADFREPHAQPKRSPVARAKRSADICTHRFHHSATHDAAFATALDSADWYAIKARHGAPHSQPNVLCALSASDGYPHGR